MLFKVAHAEAIARGEVTCTIRKWKRPQAVPGNTYATSRGHIAVTSVEVMQAQEVSPADLAAAGFDSLDGLAHYGVEPGDQVHVVRFEVVDVTDEPDPGEDAELSDDQVAGLDQRLEQMDRGRPRPWTLRVLAHLAEAPGTRSADIAAELEIEQAQLKSDIRRLKRLALTRSLGTGYELSPRGRAYLDRTRYP